MSKPSREETNVGVGINKDPDFETHTVHESWNQHHSHAPDSSVIDHKEFCLAPDNMSDLGPHTFTLPRYANAFLDPKSVRLYCRCRIFYRSVADGLKQTLPLNDAVVNNPWKPAITKMKFKLNEADMKRNPDDQCFIETDNGKHYLHVLDPTPAKYDQKLPMVAPVNNFAQAMWKDVKIFCNGTSVSRNANLMNHYRAYVSNLLSYDKSALNTHMQSEMWIDDEVDEDTPEAWTKQTAEYRGDNFKNGKGFHLRRAKYCNNNDFEYEIQIHSELHSISSYLQDKCTWQWVFTRNDPNFCLLASKDDNQGQYIIRMTQMELRGRLMIPSPSVQGQLERYITSNDAQYSTTRTAIFSYNISAGSTTGRYDNIFSSDVLPDQIFMWMVDTDAVQGSIRKNPWFFDHFECSKVMLQVNVKNMPYQGFKLNWQDNQFMDAYKALYDNLSIKSHDAGLSITPLAFKNGKTIFAWDLQHDKCAGQHVNHNKLTGAVSILVDWYAGLQQNVTMMVMGVYHDYLTINEFRQATVITATDAPTKEQPY